MNKTISININGIIFHIEEEAYDILKKYLESINKYFSSFEDSKEIIDDIESRISEIFLNKLSEGNQVVTMEMVQEVKVTMGTVADFEASIGQPDEPKTDGRAEEAAANEGPKKLYRNTQSKVIGGVASGIADYFNIDPIWVRLIMLAMFFNLFFNAISGGVLLAYIILWIVLPVNTAEDSASKVKKLFRNTEDRVLGGVGSGIAAFFGVDPTVIRLLFIISIFLGGAGIILYIILWIITPEAKSITEKLQMQGEPLTLNNIEQNIKKSINMDKKEENLLVKILLFPFRLIALIITGIGKILGPTLKVAIAIVRVFVGIMVTFLGFVFMVSFIAVFSVMLGMDFSWTDNVNIFDYPAVNIAELISLPILVSAFIVVFIPSLVMTWSGVMIIAGRKLGNMAFGWAIFGIWIIGLIGLAFFLPATLKELRSNGEFRSEQIIEIPAETVPTLRLTTVSDNQFDNVQLKLRGHTGDEFKAVVFMKANGSNRKEAEANAEKVTYEIKFENDEFLFPQSLDLTNVPYRLQKAEVIFYIPEGRTFRMERNLDRILRNTLHPNGYKARQMAGNEWIFDEKGIKCITCADDPDRSDADDRNSSWTDGAKSSRKMENWEDIELTERTFDFRDFDKVEVSGLFQVRVMQGAEYEVRIKSDDIDNVFVRQLSGRLKVTFKQDWDQKKWRDIRAPKNYVLVVMPTVAELELSGACSGQVVDVDANKLTLNLEGASDISLTGSVERLSVVINGASRVELSGSGDRMDVSVNGASNINAYDFIVNDARVNVFGASKARIYAQETIKGEASGISTILYKGNPDVTVTSDRLSTVKRD